MNDNKQDIDNIDNFFDSYAAEFSSIYMEDSSSRSSFNKLMDRMYRGDIEDRFEKTLSYTSSEKINSILDIGCGPGHYVLKFLEQGKEVTALDIADGMLEITKSRVRQNYPDMEFTPIKGDYLTYDFGRKFDAACVMGFFDYVADPVFALKKLLSEVNQEIYISIPWNKGFLAFQRKIRYRLRNCPLYLYSKDELIGYLKQAGCYDQTEIIQTERGYYIVIRVQS